MTHGKFITLEGTEGAGKTTAIEAAVNWARSKNINLVVTREPGGTATAEKIRSLLLNKENKDILPDTELMLMFAARSQHLNELIIPALKQGSWVLCDRFTDASYAYQGGGRGIDMKKIEALEQWVQGSFRPDITLLLDLPVEVGLARASQRSEPDRFEIEKASFFERVREVYLQRAEKYPDQFHIIDATKSIKEVENQVNQVLDKCLT